MTSKDDATIFIFEGSENSWSIKVDGTSNYLSLASSKANGKFNIVSTATNFTLSNQTAKGLIRISLGSYSIQKNNSTTNFGSYANTQTDVWIEAKVDENIKTTTTSFGEEVDNQTFDAYLGDAFEAKIATIDPAEAGSVTYSSDKPDVASVDAEGNITIGTVVGIATITASFAGNDEYQASSAKYYINVKDPNAPIFYESFDKNSGTGGNDGKWSGSIATSDLKYDNSGWTCVSASGASKCAKFGSSSAKGSATTPSIELGAGVYNLTFKAGGWNTSSEKTTINVSISNGTLTYEGNTNATHTITMAKGAWTDYAMTISGATNSTTIKFEAVNASNNRFFLDEVKIIKAEATPTLAFSESTKTVYFGEENDFSAPTLTLKDADGNIVDGATYNYVSSNPEAITVDNSGNITFVTKNKPANVTITATYAGDETYNGVEASYTINYIANPYKEYQSFKEIKTDAASGDKVRIKLNNAKVVYAYTHPNSQIEAYVRNSDAKGDAICFYNTGLNIKQNDILNGTLKATYTIFNGLPELKECTNTEAISVTPSEEAALPKEITLNDLADNSCDLITVKGVLMDGSDNTPQVYNKFTNYEIFNNATIDLTGIIIPYEKGATTIATSFEIAPTNKYDIVYQFSENDETTHVGAVTDAKVAIERTLSNKYWNTLCLPFSLDEDQITATFDGGTITEFSNVNAEGTVMTFKEVTSIEAGKPYLFKPAKTVENPVFEGVTITSADAGSVTVTNTNGNYAFVGTYSKKDMATDQSEVFITTSGKLSYPAAGTNTIKGMRAFIQLPKTANAKAFNLNIGGEATSIDTIDGGLFNGNATIYNLNGQKMSSDINGLAKGLYIVNGKKMIVK